MSTPWFTHANGFGFFITRTALNAEGFLTKEKALLTLEESGFMVWMNHTQPTAQVESHTLKLQNEPIFWDPSITNRLACGHEMKFPRIYGGDTVVPFLCAGQLYSTIPAQSKNRLANSPTLRFVV